MIFILNFIQLTLILYFKKNIWYKYSLVGKLYINYKLIIHYLYNKYCLYFVKFILKF